MQNHRRSSTALTAAVLALAIARSCTAQSDNSSLSGGVTDASGAVIPNAKVTIHNDATGSENVITTGESGNFNFPNVQTGNYTVRIEATGFSSVTLNSVRVDPSIGRRVDINMRPGETASVVTVEAGANGVQTESAVVGQLVTQEQVRSIQLNGRNPLYLSLVSCAMPRWPHSPSV